MSRGWKCPHCGNVFDPPPGSRTESDWSKSFVPPVMTFSITCPYCGYSFVDTWVPDTDISQTKKWWQFWKRGGEGGRLIRRELNTLGEVKREEESRF